MRKPRFIIKKEWENKRLIFKIERGFPKAETEHVLCIHQEKTNLQSIGISLMHDVNNWRQ